jgi:ABC-type transport system involved in multi-copper enzyme maturation permease subunit
MAAANPRADPLAAEFYLQPVVLESFLAFLALSTLISCRSIAKDRAADALELYWTRSVTPAGYFLAKWFGSFLLVGVGFVLLPACLWVFALLTAPDESFLATTATFLPRVLLALCAFTAAMTWIATGFSALCRSATFASILWVLLLVGSTAIAGVLSRLLRGETWLRALSPWSAARRLAEWIAGVSPRLDHAPIAAAVSLGVLVLIVGILLARRLRLSEAVT